MSDPRFIDAGPSGPAGWHAHGTFAQCPQAWAYRYRLNLVPLGAAKPLVRGSMLHAGLAHHYAGVQGQTGIATPAEAVDHTGDKLAADAETRAVVHSALEQYVAGHAHEAERLKVIGVEQVLEAEINGNRYTQRADLIVEGANGGVVILDHKGVGFIDGKTSAAHTLNGQMVGYKWLGRQYFGDRFGGVVLNLIQLGREYRTLRRTVEQAPEAVKQFPDRIADIQRAKAALADRDPWEYPKALSEVVCFNRYGACQFMQLCRYGANALHLYALRNEGGEE